MHTGVSKSLIFVVISVLVVALVYSSSSSAFWVHAAPYGKIECDITGKCCQVHISSGSAPTLNERLTNYCTDCDPASTVAGKPQNCSERYIECTGDYKCSSPEPTTGPIAPLQDGVLEPLEEQPTQPLPSPPTAGESVIPGDTGVLQQSPSEGGVTQRGCQSNVITHCLPCDLGLPGASCIPASEWPPDNGQLEQGEGAAPPFVPGFLERQQLQPPPAEQGTAELPPPATEETQPATVEEEPVQPCPEGQVLDEETNLCVLEEQEEAEEPTAEEDQPSEESD